VEPSEAAYYPIPSGSALRMHELSPDVMAQDPSRRPTQQAVSLVFLSRAGPDSDIVDAATLYTIVKLATGQHRTEAHGFPSVAYCEAAAKKLREQEPLSSKTQIYCVKHEGIAVEPRRRLRKTASTSNFDFPF